MLKVWVRLEGYASYLLGPTILEDEEPSAAPLRLWVTRTNPFHFVQPLTLRQISMILAAASHLLKQIREGRIVKIISKIVNWRTFQEKCFPWKHTWVWHRTVSLVASNHFFGRSHWSQLGSLTAHGRSSSLVKAFALFTHFIGRPKSYFVKTLLVDLPGIIGTFAWSGLSSFWVRRVT